MKLHHKSPPSERYIRRAVVIPHVSDVREDDDEPSDFSNIDGGRADDLKIILCMLEDFSKRMKRAKYLQSDIGFKQVTGFYEFEIGSMDRNSNTSKS